MIKRILALALGLALLLGVAPAYAQDAALPRVGDQVAGFVVKSVTPMEPLGATGLLFEHVKTGAELLYLASEDTNRSFDITFKTPALDDKGKPHVFEHITICGSQKYPNANMFFPLVNQTYNTFVNAFTTQGMTSYPVASLSEDQLMTLMDYYLSGVFKPLVYIEPRMVNREAWRYELTEADQPLTIAGTVYSEMQGVLNIATQADYNNTTALFGGSPVAHVSGGIPSHIRTLTQQELLDFHDAYYHPSNSLIILYGKLDCARFLSAIDEYLSEYERADVFVEKGAIEPYDKTLYATYDFPVEMGAQTENASYIYYSFAAEGAELEDYFRLNVLSSVLSRESSPLMRAMREALPNASVMVSVNIDQPVPALSFIASGVNEGDRDVFVKAVDDCLAQLSQSGLYADDVDAVLSAHKLSLLLTAENTDLGVNAGMNIALTWAYFDRVDFYNVYEKAIDDLDADSLKEALDKWLLNNAYRAVSVTKPAPGLAEQNAEKLENELAQIKAAMSEEEIDELVRQTADFIAWSAASPEPELMDDILCVTPDTLPEELVSYDVKDETLDGVRYVTSEAPVGGVAIVNLILDASTIPAEKLQDVAVYLGLLGKLDTEKYTKEELSALRLRYLNGFGGSLTAQNSYSPDVPPLYAASMNWMGLEEDVPQSVSLLREILLNTDITDTGTIRDIVGRDVTGFIQNLDANILDIQFDRLEAAYDVPRAFNAHLSGYDFFNYQKELLELDDEALISRLVEARELVNNRCGAIVMCAGDAGAIDTVRGEMASLLGELPEIERPAVDFSGLLMDIKREALVVNSTVQMNIIAGKADYYTGKEAPLVALMEDNYLTPILRNALGAYGAYSSMSTFTQALYTYRDPNLAGTYEIFEELPEFLRSGDITQEMIDIYIVGSYSMLSRPVGALSGAMQAATYYLTGLTEDMRLGWMREAKSTTVDDARALAERIEKLVATGARSTSATASTIEANRDLFDDVVRLEEAKPAGELSPAA